MKYQETESIELKRNLNDSFAKEVVAFLNTRPGVIYIGVDDSGDIIGVDSADEIMKEISNIIRDKILPCPEDLISINANFIKDKIIIQVSVQKGNSLFYIKKHGRSSKGCYTRIGTSTRGMSEEQIDKRFKDIAYANRPGITEVKSRRQDLTFDQFKVLLAYRGVHVNENAFYNNFNLKRDDGLFNLQAFLLSDQNDMSIKVVRFKGTDKSEFISRKEFGYCCLIKAMADALDYSLNVLNIVQTNIVKAVRVDTPYFDESSFREAWINAICHNDYLDGTPPAVYGFDNRVEIISHGKLQPDLSKEDFFQGVSKPVNKELAQILIQMHYIEQSGRGIPIIVRHYGEEVFHFGTSFIQCIIPYNIIDQDKTDEMNGKSVIKAEKDEVVSEENLNKNKNVRFGIGVAVNKNLSDLQRRIMLAIKRDKKITIKEIATLTNKNESTIIRNINILKKNGLIRRVGSKKYGYWVINE